MVIMLWAKNTEGKIGHIQKNLHSLWTRKTAFRTFQIDDYVKHIFKEHNQEADHGANVGAKEQRNFIF